MSEYKMNQYQTFIYDPMNSYNFDSNTSLFGNQIETNEDLYDFNYFNPFN